MKSAVFLLLLCSVLTGCSPRDGNHRKHDRSGRLMSDTQYQNGKIHGKEIEYHPSGRVKREADYVQGFKNGIEKFYDEKGNLTAEIGYAHGKVHGMTRQYYPNKKIKSKLPYRNGLLEGESQWFYPNGRLQAVSVYSGGKKNGTTKSYEEDAGALLFIEEYQDDRRVRRTEYDPEGRVTAVRSS